MLSVEAKELYDNIENYLYYSSKDSLLNLDNETLYEIFIENESHDEELKLENYKDDREFLLNNVNNLIRSDQKLIIIMAI